MADPTVNKPHQLLPQPQLLPHTAGDAQANMGIFINVDLLFSGLVYHVGEQGLAKS